MRARVVWAGRPARWLAGISLGVAVAVGVGATIASPIPFLAGFVAGTGVLLLAGALALGRPGAVVWGAGGLVGAWMLAVGPEGDGLRPAVALAAAGCLLATETAYWSLEARLRRPGARLAAATMIRRGADLAAVAIGTVAAGVAVFALAATSGGSGLPGEAMGIAGVLALFALIVALVHRADLQAPAER